MAAGLGYKEFATGDVLTAAAANGYLASQVVMVFADAAARTAAITSPQEGMITYLKDTDVVQYYSGSAYITVGGTTSPLTTKGDLFTFSTANARLGVGANDTVLVADSTTATGLKWATPANGGGATLLSTTTLSGATITLSSLNQTYKNLYLILRNWQVNTTVAVAVGVNGDTTAANYTNILLNGFATTVANVIDTSVAGTLLNNFGALSGNNGNMSQIFINDYTNTSSKKIITSTTNLVIASGSAKAVQNTTTAYNGAIAAITSLEIKVLGGTWSGGTALLYGVN